ncbi:transposase family protein [Streptomyces sp. Midd1]|uniref:transposase family protein n=1 Tax=Streptomyces sp. Midd3 TaxID=3161191 RepID=UPI0034DB036F
MLADVGRWRSLSAAVLPFGPACSRGRGDRLHEGRKDIADLGFVGLDTDPDDPVVITGYQATRTKPLTSAKKQANKLIAAERATCEHAFAHLKNWRILTKLRLSAP